MQEQNAHIAHIPVILKKQGVEKIIISPGSRNGPLIQVFSDVFKENCISIVDERSAGYFALGIAVKTRKTVVLLSTSGTATLNYAPAVAEAFHQGVPLLVLTADRPPEWIDMQDNQTIRQQGIYGTNCKAEYELPVRIETYTEKSYFQRIINQAFNLTQSNKQGPVHINIPLREPLYNKVSVPAGDISVIKEYNSGSCKLNPALIEQWNASKKILVVIGQLPPDRGLNKVVEKLAEDKRIAFLAEPIANINAKNVITQLDIVSSIKEHELKIFQPELVVYFGGQVVSKSLKIFLRNCRAKQWFVSSSGEYVDTYEKLEVVVKAEPTDFLERILEHNRFNVTSDYQSNWLERSLEIAEIIENESNDVAFSDLSVLKEVTSLLDKDSILFAGNSSVIRYLQLFPIDAKEVYANRGTSGIDGCLSTASGIASVSKKNVLAILGDMSFVYDSNALWNRDLPKNLKIVVINNQGGNIFGIIEGPSDHSAYNDYFLAYHPVKIEKLAGAFGVGYYKAESIVELKHVFKQFITHSGSAILEIITAGEVNPGIFRNFIKKISN